MPDGSIKLNYYKSTSYIKINISNKKERIL